MVILLLLATFAIFAAIDYFLSHGKAPVAAALPQAAPHGGGLYVDGFHLAEDVQYHPGHAWCQRERKHRERVGVDEFAASLAGTVEKIDLPKPGTWIRQGQKSWAFWRNGQKVEMVSPTEGEVIEVNEAIRKDPALLRRDPYGAGWLMVVNVPDEESTTRNLLPKHLIPAWMRNAVEALYAQQPELAGATAADGGRPVEDIGSTMTPQSWRETASKLFLTA